MGIDETPPLMTKWRHGKGQYPIPKKNFTPFLITFPYVVRHTERWKDDSW